MSESDSLERDLVKCEDMRLYAERARRFLGSRTVAEFESDEMVQAAVVRCLEVIGEAARLVSEQTRRRAPQIPWPLIVGMRHILAHHYRAVDLQKVYDIVTAHLPGLLAHIPPLIADLERDVRWDEDR